MTYVKRDQVPVTLNEVDESSILPSFSTYFWAKQEHNGDLPPPPHFGWQYTFV